MPDIVEIKKLFYKAYIHNQDTRERAADDLIFYWITQWDDTLLAESPLLYRGQFDILRKAGRDIMSGLDANPVQVDFEPVDDGRDDAADLIDGLYRTDDRHNSTLEAYRVAKNDAVVCGLGAWELYAEYENIRGDKNLQVIRRKPVYEANNTLFWDPNAKSLDKSDATHCFVLCAYSEDGYKDLYKNLTGEEPEDCTPESFAQPEQSYVFPWMDGEGKVIYVVKFFKRELVKDKILTFTDPVGLEVEYYDSDVVEVIDELVDGGYELLDEREVKRYRVTKYIASGREVIAETVLPGEHIPIIPMYGERAIVEDQEHWEGITRLAKDPQRLRNFQMSYLADIVSQSPRQKPIYHPEQIANYEFMFSQTGSESTFPYLLMNRYDTKGQQLPLGPIATTPEQQVPTALIQSIALSKEAVEDVANPGTPQNLADPDLSGKAVYALQNQIDEQSMVYQEHMKHAKRRDGEVYASMAAVLYDVPRSVTLTLPDNTRKRVQIMESVIDGETGETIRLHDLNNAEFNVYSDIGPSYSSKREQTVDRLVEMIKGIPPQAPLFNAILFKIVELMDGVNFDDLREYSRKQLVLMGFKEPETDEEKQMLVQAQQSQGQPSADMILAMAEDKKGQADLMEQQRKNIELMMRNVSEGQEQKIKAFDSQTKRMDVQVKAQKAGADIDYKRADTFGKQLENQEKIIQLRNPAEMTDDELLQELLA